MDQLQPGDVVRSKLDATPMTVRSVDGVLVVCDWFIGSKPHRAKFNATVLTKIRRS